MKFKFIGLVFLSALLSAVAIGQEATPIDQYKLLATTRTKTMQKELDQAAAAGYRVKAGSHADDSEMVLFLSMDGTAEDPYEYKLLATTRTGTMNKELNQMGEEGYRLIPSTMLPKKSLFGGEEVVVIMERSPNTKRRYEYKLLATNRTSTMQKEVTEATVAGFVLVGMVSRGEHMVIMEREVILN